MFFDKKKSNRIKTPTVLQMEATECGAASLAMVLAYYGLWLPLEEVRDISGVSRDGLSAASIAKAARFFNCDAKGLLLTTERLREMQPPMILYWEFNHFLVFEGIEGDIVYLNDPAMGHRRVPVSKFEESYTGVAMEVLPGENFQPGGKPYSVLAVLKNKLLKDKTATCFVLLSSFFLVVPALALPAISQVFIDDILSGKHADWMFNAGLLLGGMLVLTLALNFVRLWVLTSWQNKLDLTGSGEFFRHIIRLPMQFFSQRSGSEVANRVAFNAMVAQVLTGQAATAALDLFMVAFYLFLLLQYNVKLTLLGVFFTAVNVTAFLKMREYLKELTMQMQQDAGREFATSVNGIAQIETLKANGNEDDFFARWSGYHTKVLAGTQKAQKYNLLLQFMPLFTAGMQTALLMTVGGFDIMDGMMSTGAFLAFQGLMGNFLQPVNNLLNLGTTLQTTEMCMKRLDDVMQYDEDDLSFPRESVPEIGKGALWGEVELRDVTFGYNRTKPPLFTNFNMHLHPGDWVALVGGSGCGKSTVAKLIEGVFEEWSGQVLFDGILRRQVPADVFHNSLAVVAQDVSLIRGSVEDNITLYDSTVSRQDVVRAAMDACIYDDILNLPKGFETEVLEGGANFSGGQRQRLEIARALATNPSILILDEATSALDTITEEKVISNIRHRGCTCILVAHRLSTIRDCDEIIVLDHGNVVERGRHGDLMALDGEYAKLVRSKD